VVTRDPSPAEQIEEAWEVLRAAILKRTRVREIVLEFLVRNHGPFGTEELFAKLKSKKLDLVTLYRTLASFDKAGVVRRCDFGDGIARYEFQLSRSHRHHVICKVCRKARNFDQCFSDKLEQAIAKMGYSEISHTLEFFGVCKSCRKV